MGDFNLNARQLVVDETTILFGKALSNTIAIKALDVENYMDLLDAIYNGVPSYVPCLSHLTGYNRVYVYCDLPVGSRYYAEQGLANIYYNPDPAPARTEVYNIPIEYVKYRVSSFFAPKLSAAFSAIDPNITIDTIENVYTGVDSNEFTTCETLLGGCFLTLENNKIISLVSFSTISNYVYNVSTNALNNNGAHNYPEKDQKSLWYYSHYFIPSSVAEVLNVPFSPEKLFVTNTGEALQADLQAYSQSFHSLFSWDRKDRSAAISISNQYLKYNGYFLIDNIPHIGIIGADGTQTIGSAFEDYCFDKQITNMHTMFSFMNNINRYLSSKDRTFLFVNNEKLENSRLLHNGNIPELFALDTEFFTQIYTIIDNKMSATEGNLNSFGIKKAEFYISSTPSQNLSELESSRYETVSSKDGKYFFMAKTSKTKAALKQAAISRNITTFVEPIINFVIRLFACNDFETGHIEKRFAFPLSSEDIYGIGSTNAQLTAWSKEFDKQLDAYSKLWKDTYTSRIPQVETLYNNQSVESLLSMPRTDVMTYSHRNFTGCSNDTQKKFLLGLLAFGWSQYEWRYVLSSNSGMINLLSLADGIYKNARWSKFQPAHMDLQSVSYRDSATGRHMHYMYTTNFVDSDARISEMIESCKDRDYFYSSATVGANTSFSFSQDAADTFNTLRKCKLFKDYDTWFTNISPVLLQLVESIFKVSDPYVYKFLTVAIDCYGDGLHKMAEEESKYAVKKVSKRKSKVASTTQETDQDSVTDSVENTTESEPQTTIAEEEKSDG